ncbi:37771_t:CDS:1, partial [Gigaspora margarita]
YRFANDQLESARHYLKSNPSFKLLYQDQHSLAFLTPLLFILPSNVTKTIVVDSTYGTNRLKYELFAILGTIDGSGFPLSYFFLEPKCPYGKTHAIATWFQSLKENGIQNVKTILTDKDRGQISAANKIWTGTRIQLCYWHVLRAIKKKLSSTGIAHNYYNSHEAHLLCPTINPAWQPVNQNQ